MFQWTCLNNQPRNQLWYLHDAGNGTFYVTAAHSGRCLDVDGAQTREGANVWQWDCLGLASQRWAFTNEEVRGGNYLYSMQAVAASVTTDSSGRSVLTPFRGVQSKI